MISYNDNGHLLLDDQRVYATLSGGILSVMMRATNRDTFLAMAEYVGLMVHANPGVEAVLNEEGNVIQEAVEPSGPLVPIRDVTITELGPYVITPGTYDDEGREVSAPVLDNRHHVNLWLGPTVVARNQWQAWLLQWMANGDEAQQNKHEDAIKFQGIELIDPATVETRANVLL